MTTDNEYQILSSRKKKKEENVWMELLKPASILVVLFGLLALINNVAP